MNEEARHSLYTILEATTEVAITPAQAKEVLDRLSTGSISPQEISAIVARLQGILKTCNDLRREPWKGSSNPLAGHCYVASETLFHLLGGATSAWTPQSISHEGSPHWYLKNKETGEIVDPTASQFQTPVPYAQGKGKGFLTKLPSKRTLVVLRKHFDLEP